MLISEPSILQPDPMMALIAMVAGNMTQPTELRCGVYEIGSFGSSSFLPEYESYPELSINSYGVCDNLEQILEQCPELENDTTRKFVITLTKIEKATEPEDGGWRWHKWGPYIGIHESQCEYLVDEPNIDEVYVYHIYEKSA